MLWRRESLLPLKLLYVLIVFHVRLGSHVPQAHLLWTTFFLLSVATSYVTGQILAVSPDMTAS
ncbi:hypothetical protein BH23GEM5_BH23GEM5_04420 [soil metagenome]